jgi:diguanylate cyclase (GGDEF)-like protein
MQDSATKRSARSTARLWFAALVSFIPLVIILAIQSAIDLSVVTLVLSTVAAIAIGSCTVVALGKPRETGEAAQDSAGSLSDEEAASRDPLTGLRTFQPFSQRLLAEYERVKLGGGETAVVLADISQLALINAEFGTSAGDQVLCHVAACLEHTKRGGDIVARVGDDEFAMLLPNCGREGAEGFVSRAQSRLSKEPLAVTNSGTTFSLWIGICAGIAVCDGTATGADESLNAAIESLRHQREERDLRRPRWTQAA